MKRSEFISLVRDPSSIKAEQINGIQDIVSEFPYFTSAHVLLTKAYHQEENINFENQLRKTAAYAADRKRLHELLFADQKVQSDQDVELSDDLTSQEIPEPEVEAKTSLQNEQEVELTPNHEKVSDSQPTEEKDPFLEQQILTEAINSSILMEVDDEPTDFDKLEEEQKTIDETSEDFEKTTLPSSNFDEGSPHSFSDWLNHYSESVEETGDTLWKNTSNEAKEGLKAFSPRENRPKQEFYSASKMAKLSVQDDGDLVTETLAKIYAAQGSLEKAITAYEKLQLKYPEKKVYFAGRIKELKNQLNS